MRTSASSSHTAAPQARPPFELTVSLVPQDAAGSVLRTVQRARRKPMGRFRKWTIEHTNTRCDVVRAIRAEGDVTSDVAASIIPGTTFVLDLIGQRVGRLYRARTATSPQDVLHDADAVYDVHDIRRVDTATDDANVQYRLRMAPYTAPFTTPTDAQRGASSRSFTTSRPVWGSRLTVFFDTQERLDGRVVWADGTHIDVQVTDTAHAKVWVRVTPSAGTATSSDSLNRPSLTEYRLDRVDLPTGASTWQASQRTLEATVDRLRYRARADDGEAGDAEDAIALRRHLARAAPRGFSHVVLLQATSDASTVAHVHNDSVEPVHVVQVDGATSATIERSERMDRTMPQAFPWSPTQYMERVLAVRTGRHGTEAGKTTMGVPLHLQPAANAYRSWLQSAGDVMGPAREVDRYHVLLPSAFDLRDQHPLRSCETSAVDTVYLDVAGPDARRMVEYVLADEVLGKGLQGQVMHDVQHRTTKRVKDGGATKPHTSVRILTNVYSSRRLRRVLLGQAIVTLVDKKGNIVQSAGQREEALQHGDRALTRHWGYMGGHWQYDVHALASTSTDSLMWHASAFHTPVTSEVENEDPTQPLPLVHTTLAPMGNQGTTAPQFQITPTTYWPPRNTHEDHETRGQCLRRIRPKPYARIVHKDVAKQMAGTGFKMLMDIEELRNPGWCNVDIAGEADLVSALHTYTTGGRGVASTRVGHVALTSHVHTIPCDANGHIGRLYFARFPAADSEETDAQATCRSIVSRHVVDATVRAHPATSLLRYGYHTDASALLPPLSHYLYGTHDRPKRGVGEAFQCKPTLVRRIMDGYGTRRLIVEGVYSQARWSRVGVASLTTRPGAGVSAWRLTVDGATPETQTVSLSRKLTPTTTESAFPLRTLCTAWTRALRKAFPNARFEVRYDDHTQTLGVTAQRPFTVHTGMHEWGVPHNRRSINRAGERHHIVEASVAALCGRGPYALRAPPTYVKPGTASTVRICYKVSTDGSYGDTHQGQGTSDPFGQQETVPVSVVCTPYPGVEPFEAADTARFMTRPGRHVGRSRYTSVPIAGHPLHVGIEVGEKDTHRLLIVRAHHVALVDPTTGSRLHGATLDWSSRVDSAMTTPTDMHVDARVDATTRQVDMWRVVHRTSGETRTVTVNNQRVVVTETPPGVSVSEALCRTYQRTLRGELVYEVRPSVDQATGGHRVDVWRLLRHQESTVQTRLQQVELVSEALAATFVTDPSTGARFVVVAEANATLTLHAVREASENEGVPVTMSDHPWHRLFPRTLPQSSTLRPHKRLVAMGAVCSHAVSGARASGMNIALGFDGRAELEWLSLAPGSSAASSRDGRRMCRPAPVSSLLTGKDLAERGWWWRPHVQCAHHACHTAVQVTLRGPKRAAAVTIDDCRLGLAAQMEATLSQWLGAPLDTLDIHYVLSHESLPFGTVLMQYLLQTVVGHHRTSPSTTFARYVHDRATMLGTPLTLDPRVHLRAYYSLQPHDQHTRDNEVVDDPLYKLPREASQTTLALSRAYHTSVAHALVPSAGTTGRRRTSVSRNSRTTTPPSARRRRPTTSGASLSTEAKRAVFYAKVQRLLQDHREGVPYVQRVYRRSAHFRAQFHDCKGFCYQRLLCRCRVLHRGQGYGTRVEWSNAHRDATTFLADGEAYHLCQTCGERVCPQDAGLSKDYDAMGMSSTHSESAHDQRLDDDALATATDAEANNERKDWTLRSHQPIEQLLRRLGLLNHRPKLDALLVTNAVFKLLPGGKAAVPRVVKAPGCTLQTAQRLLDASAAGSLVRVYACAADALLLAMDRRNVLGSRVPPVPRSAAKERAVVESFEPQFTFAAEELTTGVSPRPYYRPHLTSRVNANVIPKGAHGWPRLDAIVNRIETQRPALLDPSSLNLEPTAFAQRDQYLCVPQDLHQSSRTPYTTLAQLLDPTIHPRAGDTASVPARLEFVRIHPWTRLCNALAPNAHTVLPVSNPYTNMPAAHALTATTMPKHPLAWRLHAPPTDVQRRASVAHRLLRYADATHGRFAYPLQVLLDTKLVKPQDPTVLLKWLVGVTTLTRYRITAHPPTDFRMKPAWMLYYEQMEPDNKVAEELVKGMCCRVVNGE